MFLAVQDKDGIAWGSLERYNIRNCLNWEIIRKKLRQNWQTTRDLAIETKLSSKSQKSKRLIQQLKENYANLFLENLTADQSTN